MLVELVELAATVAAAGALEWFFGGNDLSIALVDPRTGSCCDGLHPDRANENSGGESVVSYLLALAEIRRATRFAGGYVNSAPLRPAPALVH